MFREIGSVTSPSRKHHRATIDQFTPVTDGPSSFILCLTYQIRLVPFESLSTLQLVYSKSISIGAITTNQFVSEQSRHASLTYVCWCYALCFRL